MKPFPRLFFYLTIITLAVSCETNTEICDRGVAARLFYTPACSTINGYIILDSGKTLVFQHEIEEKFQKQDMKVCVEYQVEKELKPLTAECAQGEIILITSLKER